MDAESCRHRLLEPERQERGTGHSVSRIERPRGDSRAPHHPRVAGPTSLFPYPFRSGIAYRCVHRRRVAAHPRQLPRRRGEGAAPCPSWVLRRDRSSSTRCRNRSLLPAGYLPAGTGERRCGCCRSRPWRRMSVPGPACLPAHGSPRLAIVERGTVPRAGVRPEEEVR